MWFSYLFNFNWINQLVSGYEAHQKTIKKILVLVIIVFNLSCISLCISAFLFGTIYFYHMPTIQHSFPLYFHYNRACIQQHKIIEHGMRWDRHLSSAYTRSCFPVATVHVSSPTHSKLLQEGQAYNIVLKLELPETPQNLNLGMFMANMTVKGQSEITPNTGEYRWTKRRLNPLFDEPIVKTSSKPMTMKYRSSIMRLLSTILYWPFLLFDFMHESQVLDEVLFDNLMLDQKSLNWTAYIYLESPNIDVYSATLDIVAKFSGVQYLLYRWPVISFIFGTLAFFVPTFFTNTIILYFCIWRPFLSSGEEPNPATNPTTSEPAASVVPETSQPVEDTTPPGQDSPDQSSNRSESNRSSCVSSTAPKTPESLPLSGFSRRSSSSSSIEMIGQPSNFSMPDEEEATSSQSAPSFSTPQNAGEEVVVQSHRRSDSGDSRCVRRWIKPQHPMDSS